MKYFRDILESSFFRIIIDRILHKNYSFQSLLYETADNSFPVAEIKLDIFSPMHVSLYIPVHSLVRQKLSFGCPLFNRSIVFASYTSVIATGIFV